MPPDGLLVVAAAALDATEVSELHGGHQARVLRAMFATGEVVVAKLTDASMVDATELATRVDVVAALGDLDRRVCRPLPIGDRLVTEVDDGDRHYLMVVYELADGDALQLSDAAAMGSTLAGLHEAMAELAHFDLPPVAALRGSPDVAGQLLHGDFNAGNLRRRDGVVRVFDFDDCGYGPVAFDVANALYMVLFDAAVEGTPKVYTDFRREFVGAYREASGGDLADDVLDGFIDRRVAAVRGWLDDLGQAPIGIRSASPEWHATLRSFTAAHDELR